MAFTAFVAFGAWVVDKTGCHTLPQRTAKESSYCTSIQVFKRGHHCGSKEEWRCTHTIGIVGGSFPQYAYTLGCPPATSMGSRCSHRAVRGSYSRADVVKPCEGDVFVAKRPVPQEGLFHPLDGHTKNVALAVAWKRSLFTQTRHQLLHHFVKLALTTLCHPLGKPCQYRLPCLTHLQTRQPTRCLQCQPIIRIL